MLALKVCKKSVVKAVSVHIYTSTSACHEREPSGLKGQTHQVSPKRPLVTPKSETRSEISVKFGIYKVKVKKIVSAV